MAINNELALMENFKIASPFDGMDEELIAELQDELGDLDEESGLNYRTIKIPAGGQLAYEVQGDEDDNPEYLKEISGVILYTHRVNAYWAGDYGNEESRSPLCSSMDGKIGLALDTGEVRNCEQCPYNAYGSDQKGGKGKACKNMRRIYLMMDGDPSLYLLTVPPTSIKEVNKQLARIMGARGIPYTGLIVSFKLEKAINAGGIAYSKVAIEKKGFLPPAVAATARETRRQIKEKHQQMVISIESGNSMQDNMAIEPELIEEPDGEIPF